MTAPKIGVRHRECASEIREDVFEQIANPFWKDHSAEIIAKHLPEDDSPEPPLEYEDELLQLDKEELIKQLVNADRRAGTAERKLEDRQDAAKAYKAIQDESWVERAAEEIVDWIEPENISRENALKRIIEIINGCRRGDGC